MLSTSLLNIGFTEGSALHSKNIPLDPPSTLKGDVLCTSRGTLLEAFLKPPVLLVVTDSLFPSSGSGREMANRRREKHFV
jgi:hypothetical protein